MARPASTCFMSLEISPCRNPIRSSPRTATSARWGRGVNEAIWELLRPRYVALRTFLARWRLSYKRRLKYVFVDDSPVQYDGYTSMRRPLGGVEKAVGGLAAALAERGHEVKVINRVSYAHM